MIFHTLNILEQNQRNLSKNVNYKEKAILPELSKYIKVKNETEKQLVLHG